MDFCSLSHSNVTVTALRIFSQFGSTPSKQHLLNTGVLQALVGWLGRAWDNFY
ncbi:hypothetical protein BDW59DRAFT_148456 [Aspergillus cavernicola]|uniref:Uncharacterized protein n=1 Tax=Aspergillus cavernicola TaxID=176166 RepID=A0ABR4I7J0_9EURO